MTDKVCAIVGFGGGVSMGVARAFGKEGYALALVARNAEKLAANAQPLATEGYTVQTFTEGESLRGDAMPLASDMGMSHPLSSPLQR